MVSFLKIYELVLGGVMKMAAGITPKPVEIEPGTTLNIWVPTTSSPTKKPAVVFLHGFAFDGVLTWQFQASALAKDYAVYIPDFLFFGGSTTDKAERKVEFQAECVAKGLRKLGVEKCTLVGLSYGGMVGFKMAEMYPDLVHSMVVTCSVMALTDSVSNAALDRIGFSDWPAYLLPATVDGVRTLLRLATYWLPKLPNCIYKDILENNISHNRKEKNELLKALVISDKDFTIPCYHQRIHLLWGKDDMIFDLATAHNLKQQIGEKASIEYIENSGHLVQLERPCVYNSHLKKILASLSSKENDK